MNLIQYVAKNQARFDEVPFNEVDSLVICELSYLHYSDAVAGAPTTTMRELCEDIDFLVLDTLLPRSDTKLLREISQSPRFADVKVGYFSEQNSREQETRFAAVTFQLTPDLHYVAYRGTDITLLGWKEDFNMSFLKAIPSQQLALSYLEDVSAKIAGDLIVGGHSKGGNLAVYAAVFCNESTKSRVVAVYDHDGPGFREDIFTDERYLEMIPRIHKTVPHDSIIGMLLNVMQIYEVVESNSFSVMQHNPFSWEIEEDWTFKKLPSTTRTSVATDMTLTEWIGSLDQPTSEKLVSALFNVLYASGADTVPELMKRPLSAVRNMRKGFNALDEDSKQLLRGNGKELLRLWFKSMREVFAQR